MLHQGAPEGVVIFAGVQHFLRDFVNAAAPELGTAGRWEDRGVDEKGCLPPAQQRGERLGERERAAYFGERDR